MKYGFILRGCLFLEIGIVGIVGFNRIIVPSKILLNPEIPTNPDSKN
jgi:hypothetical protein